MSPADIARLRRQTTRDLDGVSNAIVELCDEIDLLRSELDAAKDTIAELQTRIELLENEAADAPKSP